MKKLITIFTSIFISGLLAAQVTIGSQAVSVDGSLLQLKQNERATDNATLGLGMPRVKLTNKTNLYPMFETVPGNGESNADYNDAPEKAAQDAAHIGLWVYNTNECNSFGPGLYVWNGELWTMLNLGAGVIEHPAKAGVYEAFTSADFGAAGHWMTTNLSAKAYDTGATHSQSRTLQIMPNGYTSNFYDVAYWAYPNTNGSGRPQLSTEYAKNNALGLLYTWDAASAGKGGDTGQKNIYNTSGGDVANQESGLPEGTAAGQQKQIQGICPSGWHLPSDYEWTELENAIIHKASQYSSLADISPSNANTLLQNTAGVTDWRGSTPTGHGTAMKEVCVTYINNPVGASKPASQGGFSAPLAGYALNGSSVGFGSNAYFWSSSSYSTTFVWNRNLSNTEGRVHEAANGRNSLFSVRCKRN